MDGEIINHEDFNIDCDKLQIKTKEDLKDYLISDQFYYCVNGKTVVKDFDAIKFSNGNKFKMFETGTW